METMFKKFSTVAAAIALAGAALFNPITPATAQAASDLSAEEVAANPEEAALFVFQDSNAIRAAHGLSQTTWDDQLAGECTQWAQHLVDEDLFEHDVNFTTGSYNAENLYWGIGYPASDVTISWMDSEGHRRNLLGANHVRQGVGVAGIPEEGFYIVCQRFMDN